MNTEDDVPEPVASQDRFDQDDLCSVCLLYDTGSEVCTNCPHCQDD